MFGTSDLCGPVDKPLVATCPCSCSRSHVATEKGRPIDKPQYLAEGVRKQGKMGSATVSVCGDLDCGCARSDRWEQARSGGWGVAGWCRHADRPVASSWRLTADVAEAVWTDVKSALDTSGLDLLQVILIGVGQRHGRHGLAVDAELA